jgi:uncharacterized repeat protein (TIGR01451 family)
VLLLAALLAPILVVARPVGAAETPPVAGSELGSSATITDCPPVIAALQNTGFEAPVIADAQRKNANGNTVPGWFGSGPDHAVTLVSNGYQSVNAASGRQFAELGPDQKLIQDLVTAPGETLSWSLMHRALRGQASVKVLIGAPGEDGAEQQTVSDGSEAWTRHNGTYDVPLRQTITRLTIVGTGTIANLLDDVTFGSSACTETFSSVAPTAPVAVEDVVTQAVIIRNGGGSPTVEMVVSAVIPEGLEYIENSAGPDGVYGFQPRMLLIKPVGDGVAPGIILPGESVIVSWQMRVRPEASNQTLHTPVIVRTVDLLGVSRETRTNQVAVIVRPSADIQISQAFSPALVAPGAATTLTMIARNEGPAAANGVTIIEQIPEGATLTQPAPFGCNATTRTVTCVVGTLEANDSRVWDLQMSAPSSSSVAARSTLIVRSTTSDPSVDNNQSNAVLSVGAPAIPTLDLILNQTPIIATAGAISTIVADVTNTGSLPITSPVVVSAGIPGEFMTVFMAGREPFGAAADECTPAAATCTFPGGLAPGQSARVEWRGVIVPEVADGTAVIGTVTASAAEVMSTTKPIEFAVNALTTLTLDERTVGPTTAAAPITKVVSVANSGPSLARAATVFMPLPAGATAIAESEGCEPAFGGFVCPLGDLAVGQVSGTRITFVLPSSGGTVVDGAVASTTTPLTAPVAESSPGSLVVGPVADLVVSFKSLQKAITVGSRLAFSVTVTNSGPGTATDIGVVLDAAREGLRVDSAVASAGNWDSTENRWVIPTLESGKQIELIVDAVAEIDGLLAPAAFVRAATPDNNGVNNTAIGSIAVVAADQPLPADDGSWLVPGLIALGLALLAGLGGWWLWTRRRNH